MTFFLLFCITHTHTHTHSIALLIAGEENGFSRPADSLFRAAVYTLAAGGGGGGGGRRERGGGRGGRRYSRVTAKGVGRAREGWCGEEKKKKG